MPHSSGGGSHGGGSHRGSHHRSSSHRSSGSRSRGPVTRSSSTPFEGATTYMYYRNKRPVFVYANYDIRKTAKKAWTSRILLLIFVVCPVILMSAVILFLSGHFPKPLNLNYDSRIYVDDRVGVVKDPGRLMASLQAFQNKTGITPVVVIYPNEVWQGNYRSLEKYAYEDYINRFDDEKHWLIVYTTGTKEDGFEDWYWEGMQGDDTDPILDGKQTDSFTKNLHSLFLDKQYSVDEAIAKAFEDLTPHVMDKYLSMPGSACLLVFDFIFLGIMVFSMDFHPVREKNYSRAEICDPNFVDQEACEYCGGIYVVGMHVTCPHCGAPVKPHDYTTDEYGNVTHILN